MSGSVSGRPAFKAWRYDHLLFKVQFKGLPGLGVDGCKLQLMELRLLLIASLAVVSESYGIYKE
jgi:hypothetical protein